MPTTKPQQNQSRRIRDAQTTKTADHEARGALREPSMANLSALSTVAVLPRARTTCCTAESRLYDYDLTLHFYEFFAPYRLPLRNIITNISVEIELSTSSVKRKTAGLFQFLWCIAVLLSYGRRQTDHMRINWFLLYPTGYPVHLYCVSGCYALYCRSTYEYSSLLYENECTSTRVIPHDHIQSASTRTYGTFISVIPNFGVSGTWYIQYPVFVPQSFPADFSSGWGTAVAESWSAPDVCTYCIQQSTAGVLRLMPPL